MKLSRNICSVAAAAAFSAFTLPISATADSLPSYAANDREMIHGRISSISGKYDLYVRDDRGYVDHVVLHDGTVINPTGLTLAASETVTITGGNQGRVFRADEVDTPYSDDMQSNDYDGAGDGYQGYPVGYPYGYGNPYAYGDNYPGYGGIYFGGGYYGGGYSGRYFGHGWHRGDSGNRGTYREGSDNRRSYARGANVGGSNRFGGTSGHFGSSGGARGGSGGGSVHH
jgi:hypothetical protein